jgi:hypothetical protein
MLADNDKLLQAERECCAAIESLEQQQSGYAMARQIVGLRDDRMKKELAVLVAEGLRSDLSATAAEWTARADKRFTAACAKIMRETAAAREAICQWEITKLKFENAQALRNDERAKLRI